MTVDAVCNAESISDLGLLLGILDRLSNIEQYLYVTVASRMERKKFVLWSSINSVGQAGWLFPNGWVSRDAPPSNSQLPHTLLKYEMEGMRDTRKGKKKGSSHGVWQILGHIFRGWYCSQQQ